jgi:integrase
MKAKEVDWKLPGFGKRTRNGKVSWIFQYKLHGKNRKLRLGGSELSEAQARKLYQVAKGQLATTKLGHGIDPAAQRDRKKAEAKPQAKPGANTLASLVPLYLEARAPALRENTQRANELYLEKHWQPLHGLTLADITRAAVAETLTKITKDNGPVAANRARSALSRFFRWAIGEGICDNNPVVGTNKRQENGPRERSLSDAETAAVWLAAPDKDYGHIVKLILLTGCRRREIGSLKWPEIDFAAKTITIPKERTKNKQEHIVPLSDAALAILEAVPHRTGEHLFGRSDARNGFSGWAKAKRDFDSILGVNNWTLHDLRRTVRTGLGKLDVQPHIAEAVLNHLPPRLIRTYDRNTYAAEKRTALDQWATHLKMIVAQATGANVTALRNRDSAISRRI